MSVFVQDEAKDYRLANKSEVPVASDWTSAAPTAADIKVAEDKTLADVLITKEEVATKLLMLQMLLVKLIKLKQMH